MKINIGYLLYKRAMLSPKLEALVVGEVRRSYPELNAGANRVANAMRKMGVQRGDRVAVLALNDPEYLELYFGLAKIGVVMVPLNHRLAPPEVAYIANDCGTQTFIFGKEFVPVVEAIRGQIPAKSFIGIMESPPAWAKSYQSIMGAAPSDEPEYIGGDDDTLTILYTSGTTGRPKGAELTHNGYYHTSVDLKATLTDVGTRMLMPLPLFHIGALAPVPMCAHFGSTMIFQRAFEPAEFLKLIQTERISWFGSVPQVLMFLRSVPQFETFDWSTIKLALVYAAPVPVPLIKAFAEKGMGVRQLYGLTECTGPASVIDSEWAIQKAGSCGPPFFHTDIRVVDLDGKECAPDVPGEVLMRTTHLMKGYYNNPTATAQTIIDGWLHTGDIAKMDADGFLYILDRKKDMIISGGENIYPAEVEDCLLGHPAIADVGVIGIPDETWGEAVKAIVVLKKGESLTQEALIEWCRDKLARFKTPRQVIVTDQIPRTPTGKILKRVLREKFN
jgi:acyl-CoA synthetase (AMP-forming)/AMP-acid ligase II